MSAFDWYNEASDREGRWDGEDEAREYDDERRQDTGGHDLQPHPDRVLAGKGWRRCTVCGREVHGSTIPACVPPLRTE